MVRNANQGSAKNKLDKIILQSSHLKLSNVKICPCSTNKLLHLEDLFDLSPRLSYSPGMGFCKLSQIIS
jgi:hypothetical protein